MWPLGGSIPGRWNSSAKALRWSVVACLGRTGEERRGGWTVEEMVPTVKGTGGQRKARVKAKARSWQGFEQKSDVI